MGKINVQDLLFPYIDTDTAPLRCMKCYGNVGSAAA